MGFNSGFKGLTGVRAENIILVSTEPQANGMCSIESIS